MGRVLHCRIKSNRDSVGEGRRERDVDGGEDGGDIIDDVAIKVVEKAVLRKRPSWLRALLQEQRILRDALKGVDGVVGLLASFDDAECAYLVMECATRGTLRDAIRRGRRGRGSRPSSPPSGPFDSRRRHLDGSWLTSAAHYSLQILKGLEGIHARNVVHCDLNPTNILLTEGGRIRIADFGSALLVKQDPGQEVEGEAETPPATNLMGAEVHRIDRGTSDYASPEVLRGFDDGELTFAVDLYVPQRG